MKYCKKCVMPETRPGITFDETGACSACQAYENRKTVDFEKRWHELEAVCEKFRGGNGKNYYDCLIAVSGGKDSHYQAYVIKELMGMNPLLVTVEDNFPMTLAGIHNLKNISEEFGCDIISLKPNIKAQKEVMRKTFENYGKPTYLIDRYIYTYPLHVAVKFGLSLVIYGENVNYEYGGEQKNETPSAREQIYNGVASGIKAKELLGGEVTEKDLCFYDAPPTGDMLKLEPVYLSYFVEWNSYRNYMFSKSRGFQDLTHEWRRTHHIENFDQIDSRAYLVHSWMKYPKFGHASATDYASRLIRYGLISREEGVELVRNHDHDLDSLALRDFCDFAGYSVKRFWEIVEDFYNREIFKKNDYGKWELISPPWVKAG